MATDPVRVGDITVVSGLPRSGTSLMMRMLEVGGIRPLTDNLRQADDDNPRGYYEYERVKKLDKGDTAWLAEAQGRAVKVIAALLPHLPSRYRYSVVFMQRAMPEILASQRAMLRNRGIDSDHVSDERMAALFAKHLQSVDAWMAGQTNVKRLDVAYGDLLAQPAPIIRQLEVFLGVVLDAGKMAQVIDHSLYRQRRRASPS